MNNPIIIREIFKPVLIEDIIKKHKQLDIKYNGNNITLYVSYINGYFFINVNSLTFNDYKIDKWKRRSVVTQKIKDLDHKYKPMLSIFIV